jgi:tripartite ATP-independent transporter DctM subunit
VSLLVLCLLIVLLLAIRVPVAFAFIGPSLAYMMSTDQSVGLALRLVANSTASFPLLAVPLFILLGCLANHAGIADRLFDFALAVLGRVRGSLGYVSVGVSVGFSWMSGSAVADAAALGKLQIPAMMRSGFSKRFALGVSGSAALIAPVMPPSIPAVVYAGLAAVSTGALFAASVVPALLMALGLCVVVFFLVRRDETIQRTAFSWARVRTTGGRVLAPLGAPVLILGGILGGYFTPTEAAAVGAAYMAVLGFAYRTLRLRDLPKVLTEAVVTTAGIMLIVASANLLGYILARERVPQEVSELVLGLTTDATVFLLLVFALSMVLGMVLDAIAVLTLTVPILLPISASYDVDPIALGVLMILSGMIGLLTPPVGTVIFVLQAIAKARMSDVFLGALPFLAPLVLICFAIIFWPGAILYLPTELGL